MIATMNVYSDNLSQGEHANHYATDAVLNGTITSTLFIKTFVFEKYWQKVNNFNFKSNIYTNDELKRRTYSTPSPKLQKYKYMY